MHLLTNRFQTVQVATLSTLREHLKSLSRPDYRFTIEKVPGDRITIRYEKFPLSAKDYCAVILPAYLQDIRTTPPATLMLFSTQLNL